DLKTSENLTDKEILDLWNKTFSSKYYAMYVKLDKFICSSSLAEEIFLTPNHDNPQEFFISNKHVLPYHPMKSELIDKEKFNKFLKEMDVEKQDLFFNTWRFEMSQYI